MTRLQSDVTVCILFHSLRPRPLLGGVCGRGVLGVGMRWARTSAAAGCGAWGCGRCPVSCRRCWPRTSTSTCSRLSGGSILMVRCARQGRPGPASRTPTGRGCSTGLSHVLLRTSRQRCRGPPGTRRVRRWCSRCVQVSPGPASLRAVAVVPPRYRQRGSRASRRTASLGQLRLRCRSPALAPGSGGCLPLQTRILSTPAFT